MTLLEEAADAVLEASVVGSFSRAGYAVRRRLGRWDERDREADLAGRTVLVTGATSGIGRAAAEGLLRMGASVRFLARDGAKASETASELERAAPRGADVAFDLADMSDLESVRAFAGRFSDGHDRLDALVHNAGALFREHRLAPDGSESTLATHVLGPFLLTTLLLPLLREAAPARVVTVSSGGMYTQRLDLGSLESDASDYDGRVAYARAKRAQVALTGEWARRIPRSQVVFHTMHPGWVDTPGIETGMPLFHRLTGPILRSPQEGADTVVWLVGDDEPLRTTGKFWHDRRRRGEHRLPWTRRGDDPGALWELCARRTGVD